MNADEECCCFRGYALWLFTEHPRCTLGYTICLFLAHLFCCSLIHQENMWNVCIKIIALVEVNDTKIHLRQVSPPSGHLGLHLLEWDQNLQSCLSTFASHQKSLIGSFIWNVGLLFLHCADMGCVPLCFFLWTSLANFPAVHWLGCTSLFTVGAGVPTTGGTHAMCLIGMS